MLELTVVCGYLLVGSARKSFHCDRNSFTLIYFYFCFNIQNCLLPLLLYKMTVDRICLAVHRGVSRDGRFVGGDARNQEPDGDTRRRDNDLDKFGPSD